MSDDRERRPTEPTTDVAGRARRAARRHRTPTRSTSSRPAPRNGPLPPPSVLESVITELLGAVPEVRDHVLEAADALLDAAKALIDAADRVVRQQRGDE